MGYFSKKEQDDLVKKGGVEEQHGNKSDMSPENITMALDMVQKVAGKKADGFFFTLVREGTKNEGIAKLYHIDKIEALQMVIRSLKIPPKALIALGIAMLDDNDD